MFRRIAMLMIPFALSAGAAVAADSTLFSPNVSVTNVGNSVICRFVNVDKKPVSVTYALLDGEGAVAATDTFEVPAGGAKALTLTDTAAAVHCRFSGKFKKKLARASIDVFVDGRSIAIAPAQ